MEKDIGSQHLVGKFVADGDIKGCVQSVGFVGGTEYAVLRLPTGELRRFPVSALRILPKREA